MREPGIHPFRITRIRYFRVQTPRFLAQEGILNDLAPPRFVISSEPDPRKTLVQWFLVIQLGFTASSHTKRSQAISPKREHIFIIIIISGSSIVSICIYVYMYTYVYIYIYMSTIFEWGNSTTICMGSQYCKFVTITSCTGTSLLSLSQQVLMLYLDSGHSDFKGD